MTVSIFHPDAAERLPGRIDDVVLCQLSHRKFDYFGVDLLSRIWLARIACCSPNQFTTITGCPDIYGANVDFFGINVSFVQDIFVRNEESRRATVVHQSLLVSHVGADVLNRRLRRKSVSDKHPIEAVRLNACDDLCGVGQSIGKQPVRGCCSDIMAGKFKAERLLPRVPFLRIWPAKITSILFIAGG